MSEFIKTSLEHVLHDPISGSRPKGGVNYEGEIPSLGGENVTMQGGLNLAAVKKISSDFFNSMSRGHLKNLDVLINKDGANTGKSTIYRKSPFLDAAINEHLFILRGREGELDQEYLHYLLQLSSIRAIIEKKITGSAQPGLNSTFIKNFPIELAPLSEQKKIASILTSVDEVIETTQKQIDKLQDLKKATMNELLTKGIGHTEFKDSELGRIPKSWEVKSIDDLCDRIIDYRGKSPPKSKSGIPLITAKNIRMGFIDKEPREYVGVDSFDGWMVRGIPKNGDIFFTTEAPLGYIALVPEYKHAVGQRVITISPNRNIYFPEFLSYFLQGRTFQKQIIDASTGSTVTGVKQSTLRKALTLTPPMKEQKDVSQIIKSIEVRINQVTAKLAQTQSLKKSLMQDLLTGKVRVQVN